MNERIYSEALHQAVSGGMRLESALKRLKEILKENGHMPLYPKILALAETAFLKDEEQGTLEVVLARKEDEKHFKTEIAALKKQSDAADTLIHIDESIIGGYIARTAGKETDASYKRSLLSIYRSLTA